jgi:hypothetical protein
VAQAVKASSPRGRYNTNRHHALRQLASQGIPGFLNFAWRLLAWFLLGYGNCDDD